MGLITVNFWDLLIPSVAATLSAVIRIRKLHRRIASLEGAAKPTTAPLQSVDLNGAPTESEQTSRSQPATDNPSIQTEIAGVVAGIELGGTTCVAAVADLADISQILDRFEVPTEEPDTTIAAINDWLAAFPQLKAIGVASFGPVDLDPASNTYGHITTTPKKGWSGFDVLACFKPYNVPLALDTDVNAPAFAELALGRYAEDGVSGRRPTSCAYVTVGTGVGVGVVIDGKPVHGLMHPEGGHVMPTIHPDDTYEGCSDRHPFSVESMACAQACAERCGVDPEDLCDVPDDDPAWDFVAYYLAQLCMTITFVAAPHFISLGGGVMQRESLFPRIREHFTDLNAGYVSVAETTSDLGRFLAPPTFGTESGIIGALFLASTALEEQAAR